MLNMISTHCLMAQGLSKLQLYCSKISSRGNLKQFSDCCAAHMLCHIHLKLKSHSGQHGARWRKKMETFSMWLALCEENPLVTSGEAQQFAYVRSAWIFSCDQAALQMVFSVRLSVCPSVRLSVCHTFFTMFPSSYHHEIFRSYYHGQKWCPCKRSRSEVKGQGHRGHDPT